LGIIAKASADLAKAYQQALGEWITKILHIAQWHALEQQLAVLQALLKRSGQTPHAAFGVKSVHQ